MRFFCDLHLHSGYSRGASRNITLGYLEKYALMKGLHILGTGDFTHPVWFGQLKTKLFEGKKGIYYLKDIQGDLMQYSNDLSFKKKRKIGFIFQTEISLMYSDSSKSRKIHIVILSPDISTTEKINKYLSSKGRMDYDGRPIFGHLPCNKLVADLKDISEDIEIIPAHIWTPYFGLFGSKSGFDKINDAFLDQTKHIYGLETGLSSDPQMNYQLSCLDKYTMISSSDAHSHFPWRIGREATIFEFNEEEISYKKIIDAIRKKNRGYTGTIEVDPRYGKYYFDGHRNCGISVSPKKAIEEYNNICPVCKKPLTIGVFHRVRELSDRDENYTPKNKPKYYTLLPLFEIIAYSKNISTLQSKTIWDIYTKLIKHFGNEFNVLLVSKKEEIQKIVDLNIAKNILNIRNKNYSIEEGSDGIYGKFKEGGNRGSNPGQRSHNPLG